MKLKDRDLLLIRLDERSNNTWRAVDKIEKHLERLNDSVGNCKVNIGINRKWLGIITSAATTIIILWSVGIF